MLFQDQLQQEEIKQTVVTTQTSKKLTGTFVPSSQNVLDSQAQEDIYTPISKGILYKKTKRKGRGDADTSPNADSESLLDKES